MRPSRLLAALAAATVVALGATATAHAADPPDLRPYYSIFQRGPAKIPFHDSRWVPQGLAYWPQKDALITSYYDKDGQLNSQLAIASRSTGAVLRTLVLNTKGHVGGLGMGSKYLWVANNGKGTRYLLSTLLTGPDNPVRGAGTYPLKASSYMTISGTTMWVGDFDRNVAYRYDIVHGVPRDALHSMSTPPQVQGMAIANGTFIYSRSFGRDNRSTLTVGSRNIVAPNMSEGIALGAGQLFVLYESGSTKYADASYRVKTVQRAPIARVLGG